LERKVTALVYKPENTAVGFRHANHASPRYPHKLALTSPTCGGHSAGVVRSRTQATAFVCLSLLLRNKGYFLVLVSDSEDGGDVPAKRFLPAGRRTADPLSPPVTRVGLDSSGPTDPVAVVSGHSQRPLKSKVTCSNCSRGTATPSAQETHVGDRFQETDPCSSISSDYLLPFAVTSSGLPTCSIVPQVQGCRVPPHNDNLP
jgi:hypothetical protein